MAKSKKKRIEELDDELKKVYAFVGENSNKGGVNATQVGIVIGRKTSKNASSWGNYRLKKLIDEGLIKKDDDTKKYTIKGKSVSEEPEPVEAEEPAASSEQAQEKNEGLSETIQNTDDELIPGRTMVEFEPHVLSQEAKDGMKKVRGVVTKVFFEDDGRRFAQVKMNHNDKKCYKRDRMLTVLGNAPADEEE